MITIRQLLDYHKDDLTFHQIMDLFHKGKLTLDGGLVSQEDANSVFEAYDLERSPLFREGAIFTLGQVTSAATSEENLETQLEKAETLAGEAQNTKRRVTKKRKLYGTYTEKLKSEADIHISLAETHESLYAATGNPSHLSTAAFQRWEANTIYPPKIQHVKRANLRDGACNLLRLARLEQVVGQIDTAFQRFNDADEIFAYLLKTIRNPEGNKRAEENGLIALCLLGRHYTSGQHSRNLTNARDARRMLREYASFDYESKYQGALAETERILKPKK